jgi:hypothetical protein
MFSLISNRKPSPWTGAPITSNLRSGVDQLGELLRHRIKSISNSNNVVTTLPVIESSAIHNIRFVPK